MAGVLHGQAVSLLVPSRGGVKLIVVEIEEWCEGPGFAEQISFEGHRQISPMPNLKAKISFGFALWSSCSSVARQGDGAQLCASLGEVSCR